MSAFTVEVVEYATGKVVKSISVAGNTAANRVDGGLNINLNHEKYFTRIVQKAPQ